MKIESFNAMKEAETKSDITYVKKANSFERSRDETKEEIKTLEKTLPVLEKKVWFKSFFKVTIDARLFVVLQT